MLKTQVSQAQLELKKHMLQFISSSPKQVLLEEKLTPNYIKQIYVISENNILKIYRQKIYKIKRRKIYKL